MNEALETLINSKADSATTYTKTQVDTLLTDKANADDVYSKNTMDAKLLEYATSESVYSKQDINTMKQVNKANLAIVSTDGLAPLDIAAGQYVYFNDVMYMATEEILTGAQLVPNANIVINPIGVTNRIGDGLKNAVTQINGLADRMTLAEEGLSSQSRQIGNTALPTTAQTLTGAIAENHAEKVNKGDLTNINLSGTTNTLQTTIPVGTVFYLNGALNIAIANIASGATFTSSNCKALSDGVLNPVNVQLTPETGITPDSYNHCVISGNVACLSISFSYNATASGWTKAFKLSPEMGPAIDVYFPLISMYTRNTIGIGYVLSGTVWFQLSEATSYKVRGGCSWIVGK